MGTINIRHQDHFHEEGFISHSKFLSDEDYAKVLDNVVITCVDICVVNMEGKILLGKRTWYPLPDWFIIGGRMKTGESFNEAASRNIKRELGLNISPDRFERLWEYSMAWAKRAQSPQENGSHTVSIAMLLKLYPHEEMEIKHNEEYESVKWVQVDEIINDLSLHPALNQLAKKVNEKSHHLSEIFWGRAN